MPTFQTIGTFDANGNVRVRRTTNDFGEPTSCTECYYCFGETRSSDPSTANVDRIRIRGLDDPTNVIDVRNNEGEDTSILNVLTDDCDCDSCRIKKGMRANSLRVANIGAYHASPTGGWRPRVANASDNSRYFLGVELETNADYGSVEAGLDRRAADMKRPSDHWIAKHDGSVSGPEFASQPASLKWWQQHTDNLSEMFRLLLHAGYRSYDGGKAGMHVNISRTAFDDADHLYRFLYLTHIKPSWSCIMAQRIAEQARHWASFTNMGDTTRQWKEWAETHFRDRNAWHEKYSCLNAPAGQDRFEFRLPRGTLRVDRFMKNLEWTVAMIEETRNVNTVIDPIAFMRRVADSRKYPNMLAFLNERAPQLIDAGK